MIGICIVSYKRAALTRRCVESVREVAKLPYQIFLVDNGSPDEETKNLLDELEGAPDVSLVRLNKNHGPAIARNVVFQQLPAEIEYLAMFDNDVVALSGWELAAIKAFQRGADAIQPKLLEADRLTIERGPNRPNLSPFAANPQFFGRGYPEQSAIVNREEEVAIVGGTGIYRREMLDRVGLLDERLHIGEDFDYSFRAHALGLNLRYVPSCRLVHDHCFDIDYDQERGESSKYLLSHAVIWHKWKKALLSPAYLKWFDWLDRHQEPMYLPQEPRWSILHRRLRRRLVLWWTMYSNKNEWDTGEALERETKALISRLKLVL